MFFAVIPGFATKCRLCCLNCSQDRMTRMRRERGCNQKCDSVQGERTCNVPASAAYARALPGHRPGLQSGRPDCRPAL